VDTSMRRMSSGGDRSPGTRGNLFGSRPVNNQEIAMKRDFHFLGVKRASQ
jgi:hypothetical protein